jgi:hypothetical protein
VAGQDIAVDLGARPTQEAEALHGVAIAGAGVSATITTLGVEAAATIAIEIVAAREVGAEATGHIDRERKCSRLGT